MSIERFFTTPGTIITAGSTDTRYGGQAEDWDDPASEVDTYGWFHQDATSEQLGVRDVTVTRYKWIIGPDIAVDAANRIRIEGRIYAVDGDPLHSHTPDGPHHIEIPLRYVAEVAAGDADAIAWSDGQTIVWPSGEPIDWAA